MFCQEFKFNPNAKSFVPSQATMRPASPVSDNSFYYPAGMAAMPHMHGMSMGIGVMTLVLLPLRVAFMNAAFVYLGTFDSKYG